MPELGLRQLIRRNDVAKVRETLEESADPTQAVNAVDSAGYTALFYAMQQRPVDLAMVQLLLDFGADPKFQKVNTFTSKKYGSGVHIESVVGEAMRQEVVEVVRLLVNAGADVRSLDASGYSSLIKAAHRRNPVAMIKYLISEGAPLDTVTQYGESAIRVAYHMGSFDAVAELLAAGADDARLKWTPLHRACAIGSESDVEWLLSQDPELEARDTWDRTPLLVAAQRGSISIFDLLLNAGADLGAWAQGSSALSLAIESGVLAMVNRLLALGFSLEEQNSWGQTPLAKAVERDDLNMARALIELGANIDAKSSYKTIMSSTESKEMIELLFESGGDPSQLSEEGRRIILGFDASMEDEILKVKPDEYQRARSPREGIANPEEVIEPFWLAMIRSGVNAGRAKLKTTWSFLRDAVLNRWVRPQKEPNRGLCGVLNGLDRR
jgi:ankyrin repeat protein